MSKTVRKKKKKRTASASKRPLAVITADWHLWPWTWTGRQNIAGDAYAAASVICEKAIEEKIPQIIVAGDLTETARPPSEVINFLYSRLDQLQENCVRFAFIQGQHGKSDPPWPLVHPNATYIDKAVFQLGDASAYALDWRSRDEFQRELAEVPETCSILIAHQVWQDFMGGIRNCEAAFSDLPGHVELLITGDFHQTKTVETYNKAGKRMRVVSPGSTHMRAIDEPVDKYYYVLYDDLSVKKEKIPTRPVLKSSLIEDEKGFENLLSELEVWLEAPCEATLPPEVRKPLLRISYSAGVENAYRRLKAVIKDRGHLFPREVEIEDESEETLVKKEDRRRIRGGGLLGCLPLVVDQKKEPELYGDLERLVQCENVREELDGMKAKVFDDEEEV